MTSSRRHLAATAISIAAGLVAGCAAAPPPVVVPEPSVPVPERWQAAPEAPTGGPDAGWVAELGGETLAALVAEALAGNQDLAAAAARLEAAAAQAVIAGADRRPAADAAFDAARRRQNFLGFPIPGAEDRVLSTTTTTLGLGLRFSWEVDLWGRVRAAESAALARVEASAADLAAARLSLAGQVARAWFGLLEAAEQVALAAETTDSRRRTRERLDRRYRLGLAPPLELRLAIANQAAAEALLAQRRRQLDAAARRLELLAGRYPAGRLPPEVAATGTPPLPDLAEPAIAPAEPTAAAALPVPPPVPAGVPAELLLRRPDLAAAERRLAAAGRDVESAEAARLPRISLTGSAGRQSQELADLLDDDFGVWSLAAGLLQPIVQGGRLAAAVDLAEARRAEARAAWRSTALAAFAEVEEALAADGFLAAREAALAEAGAQAAAALALALDRWAAGLADYLTVLEAERQTLDARSQLLAARRERLEARVDLHLALGGGFTATTVPLLSPPPRASDGGATERRGLRPGSLEPAQLHAPEPFPSHPPAALGGAAERRGLRPGSLEPAPLHAPEPFPSHPPAADGGAAERRGLRPGSLEPAQLHAPEPPPPTARRRNAGPSHPPSPIERGPVPGRSPRRGPSPPPSPNATTNR
jgi:outer membrane protein, multidrug efflux system